ncbi:hypothetical protein M1D34_31555 (plasmid) [Ensifer sp. D2-11]
MAMTHSSLGLSQENAGRTLILRVVAALIAICGAWSFSVLDVLNKLTFTYSLDFWISLRRLRRFGHWTGVGALPAILTRYSMTLWRDRRRNQSDDHLRSLRKKEPKKGVAQA